MNQQIAPRAGFFEVLSCGATQPATTRIRTPPATTLVVDASLIAGLLLPDEEGTDPRVLEAEELAAPWLLWAEPPNILVVSERRGRLTPGLAEQMLDAVNGLGIDT